MRKKMMAKTIMTAAELTEKGIVVYNDRKNWTYVQGALGQLGESDRVRGLYKYFWDQPNHAGNSMTMAYEPWLNLHGKGRRCTDCSNFINYLLGYTFSMYSTKGYAAMPAFEGDIKDAPAGTVLCLYDDKGECGHVGLSIGNDEFIDFYKYNETCRKGKISESLFSKAVYVTGIDYSNKQAESMTVQVKNKERYVGDALSADDFIVTVKNNDGSTEINPAGWQFTPLKLTNTENVIAIVYKQLISYVRVEALPAGSFWCVQVPAKNLDDALRMQKELTLAGYSNPAVIEL